MPIRVFTPTKSADQEKLITDLANEWQAPEPGVTEPVILEEKNAQGELVHVYVIWSDWAHLTREQRGEIIMDAAELVSKQMKITIAMGLTPEEADRFQLNWRS